LVFLVLTEDIKLAWGKKRDRAGFPALTK